MVEDNLPWVSYSWVFDYGCPRMFKYKRVEKAKPDTAPADNLVIGVALHEVLHRMYLYERFTLGYLLAIWPGVLKAEMEKLHISLDRNYGGFLKDGEQLLKNFYGMAEKEGLLRGVLFTEEKLTFIVRAKSGRRFVVRSYLDLVISPDGRNEIWIVDFKSGSYVPTQAAVNMDPQATLYSLGLRLVKKIQESKVVFMYIRKGKWRRTVRTNQEYQELIEDIDKQYLKVESGEFEPSYSLCHLCRYRERCRTEDLAKETPGLDPGWFK